MTGPHRVKKRKTVKLHGLKYPFNGSFTESDPISQDTLTPTHTLSLSALEARNATSRRLVSQEYSKLSAHDRAVLNNWVEEPVNDDEIIDGMDVVDIPNDMPGGMGDTESESILRSILPPARYRSWTERTHNASAAWSSQYEDLADAYLLFNASSPNREPPTSISVNEEGSEESETFTVEAVDIFARYSVPITHSCAGGRNVALVRAGYISPSPTNPTTAISIRTLDLFKFLRQRQPQLSIQAFAKTLCDLHTVPYKRYLRDQLSTTLEVYFSILRIIESRILAELRRDGPDWPLKNTCPACTFKLEEEPELRYSMVICGDGNTSLKRYLRSGENDPRQFTDTRMLEPEYVDQYELNNAQKNPTTATGSTSFKNNEEDLATPSVCAPRWKNARNENAKDTFDMLDETGVFTVLCRHGVVLVMADMVKSGERAKYPLAAFSKVIRAHGKNILIGYDIGCQHVVTARNHPMTRDLVRENCTEYIHIVVSDKDALANLGKFLYNNLQSATSQLKDSLQHRDQAMVKFGLKLEDFSAFVDCERQYLASPPAVLSENADTIEYLTTLEEIDVCQDKIDKLNRSPMSAVASSKQPVNVDNVIATRRRYLTSQVLLHMKNAYRLELELDISSRWTKGNPEWKRAEELRQNHKLQTVVDKLERLCIERMFELEKYLHGYNLRELIAKSLATRSNALKAAVEEYNNIARCSTPPREEISTRKVMDLTKVADFRLLWECREEILTQKWTIPAIREATTHALRVDRAREEIMRVQVEVRRLETWMRDEVYHLTDTLRRLETQNSLLAHALRPQLEYQLRVNSITDTYIQRIKKHPQFEGEPDCGVRKLDADPLGFTQIPESGLTGMDLDKAQSDGQSDDDIEDEMEKLLEGYSQIALVSNK
ncbi:hypothetical protein RSOL_123660, partial [Rhizoctonia solani AG-3 Rhs1AP]